LLFGQRFDRLPQRLEQVRGALAEVDVRRVDRFPAEGQRRRRALRGELRLRVGDRELAAPRPPPSASARCRSHVENERRLVDVLAHFREQRREHVAGERLRAGAELVERRVPLRRGLDGVLPHRDVEVLIRLDDLGEIFRQPLHGAGGLRSEEVGGRGGALHRVLDRIDGRRDGDKQLVGRLRLQRVDRQAHLAEARGRRRVAAGDPF
jgi:hypothetical protein